MVVSRCGLLWRTQPYTSMDPLGSAGTLLRTLRVMALYFASPRNATRHKSHSNKTMKNTVGR